MTDFISEAQSLFDYTRSLRRDFHAHPELGFKEIRTSGIVADELQKLGLKVRKGIAGTGITANLEGNKPGPVLLLRADMDALPITEQTGAEYASQNPGVMHACGHDGHVAILLTAAKILHSHKQEIAGTVKFMFQPAEEGMGGAEGMLAAGILDNPKVNQTIALHLWNEKPHGWIGIPDGPAMAGAEIFKVKVIGKGGHGAAPHLSKDPVLASAHIVTALQGIVSRDISPFLPAVVSVCTIHGGEAFNVIPPEVEVTGTIRTFEPQVRKVVLERFGQTVRFVAEGMGCTTEIHLERLTPATINTPAVSAKVQQIARQLFPKMEIDASNYATMGSEDFAFVLEKVPGCYIFFGSANPEKGLDASHHHPKFDFDEEALPEAVALLTASTLDILKS